MSEERSGVQERPHTLLEPVQPDERIQTLDVLRGFALFGILFVNVSALASPAAWFSVDWDEIGTLNYAVEALKLFFVQGKFYTLFAFLFGLGFTVQLARAEKAGRGFAARFLWRVTILWFIGLFHIVALWEGDILNTYAVAATVLLLFYGMKRALDALVRRQSHGRRERAPRRLVLVAAGLLMFGPLLAFAGFVNHALDIRAAALAGETLSEPDRQIWEQLKAGEDPAKQAEHEAEIAAATDTFANGSYLDTLHYRVGKLAERMLSGVFWFMVAGIFMVGAWFGRNNFIGRAAELQGGFRRLLLASVIVGVPLSLLFTYGTIEHPGSALSWWKWSNLFMKTASGLAFALAFVAGITLLMLTRARRWLEPLAPVGRTALSNYLLQSLVGTFVFYGYGFGLMGRLDAAGQLVYIALLFAGQVWLSRWWLARFRFGPAEWLWRSLTYMQLQPMRIPEASANPAARPG